MWLIGVEVEQETSAPPPKINPGSAPVSPGTHLVKNHEFQSRSNESQLKKQRILSWDLM